MDESGEDDESCEDHLILGMAVKAVSYFVVLYRYRDQSTEQNTTEHDWGI